MVNGGRKIAVSVFKNCIDLDIFYRRRNSIELAFGAIPNKNDSEAGHKTTYLLGFSGTVNDEMLYMLLHISSDGTQWIWRNNV